MSKILTGIVKSDKMTNTAIVVVSHTKVHPKYQKRISSHKSFHVDNTLKAKIGDQVIMEEVRPLSKNKHFRITKIVKI
jgi:small subunit ribosomal protein S17